MARWIANIDFADHDEGELLMSLFGMRKSMKIGPFRMTLSGRGLTGSVGGKRGRVGLSSNGRRRSSVNFGHGLRWTRTRKR